MALALFDLDDTLIEGDSELSWLNFLVEKGHLYEADFRAEYAEFERMYAAGVSDIDNYMRFILQLLVPYPETTLNQWSEEWVKSKISAIVKKGTSAILQKHRDVGDTVVIISASNSLCVGAIAPHLGVDHFICTQAILIDGYYTGEFETPVCYQSEKLTHLNAWLDETGNSLQGSHFYSDSHNDIPLLEKVDFPVVVDADDTLLGVAQERSWEVMSLRG